MSEIRIDLKQDSAIAMLAALDTADAVVVIKDGHHLVVMFNLSEPEVLIRLQEAESKLVAEGTQANYLNPFVSNLC